MVMYNWVLPLLIAFVATYILMSILYNNSPELRQKFSDLGALIQLQTSRPYIYTNWVPANQNVYNNVMDSYGAQPRNMMIGTRELNQGYPISYPIQYPMAYPEDYPTQYPGYPMKLPINQHVRINNNNL
jgi:hypothetical protein